MANPVTKHAIEGATGYAASDPHRLRGHQHLGVFIATENFDSANDDIGATLQVSPDGSNWASAKIENASDVNITGGDLNVEGNAYAKAVGNAAEYARVQVYTVSDAAGGDLTVDAWLFAAGNAGQGVRGNPDGA